MDETLSLGYWVRRRRKALDLTQAELGRRVGTSTAMIRKIEADERRPSRELAKLMAVALALPAADHEMFLRAARETIAIVQLPPSNSPLTAPRSSLSSLTNLPAPMTSMVNRVKALGEVTDLLLRNDVRLLTIIGPPGIGKTRLAIEAARQVLPRFAGGAWFIDLSAIFDPAQALPAISLALGLPLAPGLSPAQRVNMALRDAQLLLVLDNFEQLVEGAALDVANLLRACPGVKVLATSRVRLDVYGEHEYALPPMTLPPPAETYAPEDLSGYEAVQLFLDRARQHRPDFALTAETAAPIAEICRQMDGLPLALELSAARTRQMPIDELASALRSASGHDWHALLHTSARDLPLRQQTLFNAVAWSYSLLSPEEQSILRQLGVFEGGFDALAAAAVCLGEEAGDAAIITPMLELLVDHNLASLESRGPDRWRLLEMIREFALTHQSGKEYQAAKHRHARHFASRQQDWYTDWLDPTNLKAVDANLDNYRAAIHYALEQADTPLAHQLGIVMGRYWERRGLLYEGRAVLGKVLALPGEIDPRVRFPVLHEAITLAWMQHDFEAAMTLSLEAMALTRNHQLPEATATLLNLLGRIYLEQARYQEADQVLVEAIELSRSLSPPRPADMEIIQRGEAALAMSKLDQAEMLTCIGLVAFTDNQLIPYCMGWNNLAEIALARGDATAAREALLHVLPHAHLHARRARFFLTTAAGFLLIGGAKAGQKVITAGKLLSYVNAVNEQLGDPLSPLAMAQLAARVTVARSLLAPETWQAAWEEGQHWTAAEALAAARQLLQE